MVSYRVLVSYFALIQTEFFHPYIFWLLWIYHKIHALCLCISWLIQKNCSAWILNYYCLHLTISFVDEDKDLCLLASKSNIQCKRICVIETYVLFAVRIIKYFFKYITLNGKLSKRKPLIVKGGDFS